TSNYGGIHFSRDGGTYLLENGTWQKFYSENFPRMGWSDGSAFSVQPGVLSLRAANNMDLSSNGSVKISLRNNIDISADMSTSGRLGFMSSGNIRGNTSTNNL